MTKKGNGKGGQIKSDRPRTSSALLARVTATQAISTLEMETWKMKREGKEKKEKKNKIVDSVN